jgi:hypothetical protein
MSGGRKRYMMQLQDAASPLSRVMLEFSGGQSELYEAALQERDKEINTICTSTGA